MSDEEWRAIPGYEGLYEVSDMGRVRRTGIAVLDSAGRSQRAKPCVRRQYPNHSGYPTCTLCIGGARKTLLVHRLVAAAFLAAVGDFVVNHKDAVVDNNRAGNLEVCNHAYNAMYSSRVMGNKRGEKSKNAKLTDAKVGAILAMSALGFTGQDIAKLFSVHKGTISDILKGKSWMHVSGYRLLSDPMQRVRGRKHGTKAPPQTPFVFRPAASWIQPTA